jgi:hypothetical protein
LTVEPHGLSQAIAKRYRSADVYRERQRFGRRNLTIEDERGQPGTITVRGHVATPTKQMIRKMAPMLPVVVLPKMESRIMETSPSAEIPGDNRYDHCVQCNTDLEHDGVSIINLCWVANDMQKNGHGSRPTWLKRVQI